MTAEQFHSKTNMRIILPIDGTGEKVRANVYRFAEAYAAAQLAELTAKLPETFFVGHDLAFRLERLVDGWQRAVTANLTLEAQLAEKEREIEDLQTKCRDMAVALGNQIARAEAAEQRLQEAQEQIETLKNNAVWDAPNGCTFYQTAQRLAGELRQREAELEQVRTERNSRVATLERLVGEAHGAIAEVGWNNGTKKPSRWMLEVEGYFRGERS